MKSFLKIGLGLAFTLAFVVFPDQVSAAVASVDSLAFLANSSDVSMGLVALVSLSNIDATSYQTPNPGGIRSLFLALRKDIDGVWPKEADITAGEITVGPTMKAGKTFSQFQFPDSTCSLDDDSSGDAGFQSYKHVLEFMAAGFSKAITAELRKHLNAGCVVICEMNDGTFCVGGASDNPIFVKPGFKSGKKGADKRGFTLKGEQDGMMWGVLPLAPAAVALLALEPEV